jgi:hypothetical protein
MATELDYEHEEGEFNYLGIEARDEVDYDIKTNFEEGIKFIYDCLEKKGR